MAKDQITCATAIDERCSDLEWAADNPTVCPGSPTITGLRVDPADGEVEVEGKYQFRAFLTFSDGSDKDVTAVAAWHSNNAAIASVDAVGLATGVAVGTTQVEASYRGYFDLSNLDVIAQCFQVGMDIALVFDRSASMLLPGPDGASRLASAKVAAKAFLDNCIFTKDQVSVISFAGVHETSASGTVTTHADATQHIILTNSKLDAVGAVDSLAVIEPCSYDMPAGGRGNRCATGIGGGLQKAKEELTSSRARDGTKKVVVILTDGVENVCSPDPLTLATELQALNWIIVVVAVAVPDSNITVCGGSPTTAWTYLTALTTCDLFFTADDAGELLDVYQRIPSIICQNQTDPCFYYFTPPTSNPPDPGPTRDAYDYRGFKNWNVTWGSVDLFGIEIYPDLATGQGLYVNLNGSGHITSTVNGEITTKQMFVFPVGRYRLSMKLAGNLRHAGPNHTVLITVGEIGRQGANTQVFEATTLVPWDQAFQTHTYDFSTPAAAAGRLIISGFGAPRFGPLLDEVKLMNLDTGQVLLFDDFDEENPS